ncbi:MAG TPA: dihydrodipicolinate synthase family protein [Gemmataceae bacterium]|nr:dihydrodipicolinate synthase family protein [Gemmataceae bacterium]
MQLSWQGVFPAVTTQFRQDESLDLEATKRHLEILIQSGVSGLILCGSLGENQTLSSVEKSQLLAMAIATAKDRVPIIAGVAETSSATACRYVSDCERLGVDGFMVMPPMIYKPDERETIQFFRTVGAATHLPWMLYNNPVSYHTDVTPEMFVGLADILNLVAIKESSANPRRITELHNMVGDRYALFVGVDDLLLESAILGIDGWVAGAGIAFPKENQCLWDLTRAGKWDEARRLYRWFAPLLKLDTHVKFVQYIKLAVQEVGLGAEWVRAPRLPLAGAEREQVLRTVRNAITTRPALHKT